jgi:hypothetical protein
MADAQNSQLLKGYIRYVETRKDAGSSFVPHPPAISPSGETCHFDEDYQRTDKVEFLFDPTTNETLMMRWSVTIVSKSTASSETSGVMECVQKGAGVVEVPYTGVSFAEVIDRAEATTKDESLYVSVHVLDDGSYSVGPGLKEPLWIKKGLKRILTRRSTVTGGCKGHDETESKIEQEVDIEAFFDAFATGKVNPDSPDILAGSAAGLPGRDYNGQPAREHRYHVATVPNCLDGLPDASTDKPPDASTAGVS